MLNKAKVVAVEKLNYYLFILKS